ncbi:cytochrome P450 [Suillus ampliporus]|nr:cytochrome P450 [Suillus ampliporus]
MHFKILFAGDISHIEVLGQRIIVVNSIKTAKDMLDKKGAMYSDRPVFPVGGELCGWKRILTLLPYGDRLRQYRKHFHRVIGSRAALDMNHSIEELETHRFLKRALAKPDQLQAHVRHTTGTIIPCISHGYEVKENNDLFVDLADRAVEQFSRTIAPAAKIPEWFPGAGFKRYALECYEIVEELAAAPYEFVKDQMAAGIAPKSFTSNLLDGRTLSVEEEHVVKWSAASLYGGGADTTISTIYLLYLAMTLYPDVQKKVQAEIDAVVGPDRLPSFADRESLPYIETLAKKVLRWNADVPIAPPHCVTEDDIHAGYYIPKGSLYLPRYLPRDVSVWISTTMSLAVFDISKVVENGIEITPEIDMLSQLQGSPTSYKQQRCTGQL